jgi:hypothetical protein
MELSSFDKFCSSAELQAAIRHIRAKDRRAFLRDAYKLARTKSRKEQLLETAGQDAKSVRQAKTVKLLRVAKHLRNALKSIQTAERAVPEDSPQLMQHLQVHEAFDLLEGAFDDIGFIVAMNIASVHPHHRTGLEKNHRAIYPNEFLKLVEDRFADLPVKISRIEYALVAALNSRLDKCRTLTGGPIRPILRHKIISGVFLAAFEEIYPVGKVKTALYRTQGA